LTEGSTVPDAGRGPVSIPQIQLNVEVDRGQAGFLSFGVELLCSVSRRKEILGRPKAAVGLSVTVKGAWFESEANRYGNRRCKSRNWSGFAPREIDLDIGHGFDLGV
jgi:hypothetical protein